MDPQIASIVKALALTENGGKINISNPSAGETGELKSIFQFEPGTWKSYSKQASGQDNIPMNAQNEAQVVYLKVGDWLKNGYTPDQIASMWNAGPGEPNAYTGKFSNGNSSSGVNPKYGVSYSVPKYVDKFNEYLQKIQQSPLQVGKQITNPSENQNTAQSTPTTTTDTPKYGGVAWNPEKKTNKKPGLLKTD